MKKSKSKQSRKAEIKRGRKRSLRFKESRKTIAKKRQTVIDIRVAEKKKYEEFMKKLNEARAKGEF